MTVHPLDVPEPDDGEHAHDAHDAEAVVSVDPDAFAAFYLEFRPRVLAFLARHYPTADADDVAQETLARCYVKFDEIDRRRDPWPFVSTVARNFARDTWRRTSRIVPTDDLPEPPPDGDTTVDAVLALERCHIVHAALAQLTPPDRQLIEDRDLADVPCADMAAVRDMNPNTLRQRLYRAHQRLEVELRRLGAALGVVPVAVHTRFARLSRKLQDAGHAAGPAGAGALSAAAVAGVATVATILSGPGAAPVQATLPSGRSEVVAPVERGTRPVARPVRAEAAAPARAAVPRAARRAVTPPERTETRPTLPLVVRQWGDPREPQQPQGQSIRVPVNDEHTIVVEYEFDWLPGQGVLCWADVTTCEEREREREQPGHG